MALLVTPAQLLGARGRPFGAAGRHVQHIEIGSYAYRYLCNTSSRTDLTIYKAWMVRLVVALR